MDTGKRFAIHGTDIFEVNTIFFKYCFFFLFTEFSGLIFSKFFFQTQNVQELTKQLPEVIAVTYASTTTYASSTRTGNVSAVYGPSTSAAPLSTCAGNCRT